MNRPTNHSTFGKIATGDGLELHYERRGEDALPLVVPSASWLARDMDELAPGHTVVFYDIRGRGRSSAILDESLLGLEHDVRDLETLREHFGFERMALLGWSYHGALCARYALAHPERVERMLMVGPTAPAESPYWLEFLENFGNRCKVEWLRELEELRKSGQRTSDPLRWSRAVHRIFFLSYVADPASLERMKSCPSVEPNVDADRVNDQGRRLLEQLGPYDWREEFAGLQVPTLLIHGSVDPVALSGTREWERILPGAALEVWDGIGHMPWIEDPERFFRTANAFFG